MILTVAEKLIEYKKNNPGSVLTLWSSAHGRCTLGTVSLEFIVVYCPEGYVIFRPDGKYREEGEIILWPAESNKDWDNFNIGKRYLRGTYVTSGDGSITGIIKKNSRKYPEFYAYAINGIPEVIDETLHIESTWRYATPEEILSITESLEKLNLKWNNSDFELKKIIEK